MQSVNGVEFLNISVLLLLLLLFAAVPETAVFAIDIIPLRSMYTSL